MNVSNPSVYRKHFSQKYITAESHNTSIYFTGIQLSRLNKTKERNNVNHAPGLLCMEGGGKSFICCSLSRSQIPVTLTGRIPPQPSVILVLKGGFFKNRIWPLNISQLLALALHPKTVIFSKVGLFKRIAKGNFDYIEILP